ncbi:TPA: chemotaxis protein [Streptococcus suis]|nr:chemotaxis protein [Streptococcus suis]
MSKTWDFDQPLDDVKSTSSHEERAKIAALFHKQDEKPIEEVDYVAAFEQQQKESESKDVQTLASAVKQSQPKKVNITSDYKQHLADTIAQNNKDISACQKQIEELHQLIDEKKIQNKKLQAISVAIDDL